MPSIFLDLQLVVLVCDGQYSLVSFLFAGMWWSVQFGQFLVCCSSAHGAPRVQPFVKVGGTCLHALWGRRHWHQTCEREVTGSTLTRCAVKYMAPEQATHAHLPVTKQYNLVLVESRWCSKARKVTVGLASHWPCVNRLCGLCHLQAQMPKTVGWPPTPTVLWIMVAPPFSLLFILLYGGWCRLKVIMPGYCVAGTIGHKILSGQRKIELDNRQTVNMLLETFRRVFWRI